MVVAEGPPRPIAPVARDGLSPVGVIFESQPPALPPRVAARLELIQRITQYANENPKPFFNSADVSLASGRSVSYLTRSINAWEKVARVAGKYGIQMWTGAKVKLPLGAFIDAAFSLGPPDPQKQKYGRWRAKAINGDVPILAPAAVLMEEPSTDGAQAARPEARRGPLTLEDRELIVFVGSLENAYQRIGGSNLRNAGIPMTAEHWKLAKDVGQRLDGVVISPEELRRICRDFPAKLSAALIVQREALLEQNPQIAKLLELFFGFRNTFVLRGRLERLLQ
ncbi:hypothetical protein HYT17_02255 [Candidatus Microgenomates bacterium]|nr:hypothetical protein [Candidatus Microgenomates bacterium]